MVHNNEVRTMEHIEDYIKKELKGLDLTSEDEALDVISDVYMVCFCHILRDVISCRMLLSFHVVFMSQVGGFGFDV